MAHDVLISYSSKDKATADAVCARLESRAVRCWIAPRDILPGMDWSEAIIDGIERARLMVLVFSSQANSSRQVVHEVERAVNKGLTILPLRIEDVVPARSLEYFLSTPHWLDALTPPLEHHLDYLAETVLFLLQRQETPPEPPKPSPLRTLLARQPLLAAGGGALLVVLLVVAFLALKGRGNSPPSAAAGAGLDPALIGSWLITDNTFLSGNSANWRIDVEKDGKFSRELTISDRGSFALANGYLTLRADGAAPGAEMLRTPQWQQAGDAVSVRQSVNLMPPAMTTFMTITGQIDTGSSWWFGEDIWQRSSGSGSGPAGTWKKDSQIAGIWWQMTLELRANGTYVVEAYMKDSGTLKTDEDSWTLVSDTFGLTEGDYAVTGENSIAVRTSNLAGGASLQMTWKRAPGQSLLPQRLEPNPLLSAGR
jgi:hypothetical protein